MANKLIALFLVALIAISLLPAWALGSQQGQGQHHRRSSKKKNPYGPGSLKSFQCPSQCSRRCSKTQYHKPCMFFCQKCCRKCLCVPPGYYANKGVCPCYNNWKTKEGGPKCP
ncbi:gibberellin-regulated protein 6-like [Andrographis paniculata]|uniref:gibberellin-regulated protein 6-like n=1 Tax=Andrographis paniculata TaxID=175694 RepID=UPI0021E94EE7|nr:gibberellin-regulated protein 6-like [Andrographis paniculata]